MRQRWWVLMAICCFGLPAAAEPLYVDVPVEVVIDGDTPTVFAFVCEQAGVISFETGGDVDTIIEIRRDGRLIALDDDIAENIMTSRVFMPLALNDMVEVTVRGYDESASGIVMLIATALTPARELRLNDPRPITLELYQPTLVRFLSSDTTSYTLRARGTTAVGIHVINEWGRIIARAEAGTDEVTAQFGLGAEQGFVAALWATTMEPCEATLSLEPGAGWLAPLTVANSFGFPSFITDDDGSLIGSAQYEDTAFLAFFFRADDPAAAAMIPGLKTAMDYFRTYDLKLVGFHFGEGVSAEQLYETLDSVYGFREQIRLLPLGSQEVSRVNRYYGLNDDTPLPLLVVVGRNGQIQAINPDEAALIDVLSRVLR